MLLPLLPQAAFNALDRKLGLIHSFRCSALLRHKVFSSANAAQTHYSCTVILTPTTGFAASTVKFASLQLVQLLLQLYASLDADTVSPPYRHMFALEQVCAGEECVHRQTWYQDVPCK